MFFMGYIRCYKCLKLELLEEVLLEIVLYWFFVLSYFLVFSFWVHTSALPLLSILRTLVLCPVSSHLFQRNWESWVGLEFHHSIVQLLGNFFLWAAVIVFQHLLLLKIKESTMSILIYIDSLLWRLSFCRILVLLHYFKRGGI